jgi:hypothetical protein
VYGERRGYELHRVGGLCAEKMDELVAEWNKAGEEVDYETLRGIPGAKPGGMSVGQLGREDEPACDSDGPLRAALFKIAKVGEMARYSLRDGEQGVLKLTAIVPAQKGRRFEDEKGEMTEQVRQSKRNALHWQLIGKLVNPVREKFYLDLMKEFAPDEFAEVQKALERQKK